MFKNQTKRQFRMLSAVLMFVLVTMACGRVSPTPVGLVVTHTLTLRPAFTPTPAKVTSTPMSAAPPSPTATLQSVDASTPTDTLTPTPTEPPITETPTPTDTCTPTPTELPVTDTPTPTGTPTPTPTELPVTDTPTPTSTPTTTVLKPGAHPIYVGAALTPGYDMGVDTSGGLTDWVTDMNGFICMAYPGSQAWGAVFITVGLPVDPPRPSKDLSSYQTLSLELRGGVGGEYVSVGLKDNTDLDDGRERKMQVSKLTPDWQTFTFPLASFDTADLTKLYVVTEFVFEPGTPAETICFRHIQYLP
jgi:hypothetical protein